MRQPAPKQPPLEWTPRLIERWDWLLTWAEARAIVAEPAEMPDGVLGSWSPTRRVIRLDDSMPPVQRVSALAHQCAHAALGHQVIGEADEQAADVLAAWTLVDPLELAKVERRLAPARITAGRVAAELEVTTEIAEAALRRSSIRAGRRGHSPVRG
ncbi:ImmA/IrrE family metallo-endopeptidase [Nakamurella lactea]|uniref:ImmA/IrrE family metallo-endopeptidase n=1 Tax=Nakamurella lactea TaxID=459515 RepID=UPI0003FDCA68|nr:ImmA/IrrE family metallo-endopeptidase [Nakamurella lactea]